MLASRTDDKNQGEIANIAFSFIYSSHAKKTGMVVGSFSFRTGKPDNKEMVGRMTWSFANLTICTSRAVAVVAVLVLVLNQRNNIASHKFMNRRKTK